MATVFVGIGSNLDPARNVPAAFDVARARGVSVLATSRFYRTAAIDRPDQPDYANGVWKCSTSLGLLELRHLLKEIERGLGRIRTEDKYAARCIDLDVLVYDDTVIKEGPFTVPDPHILERPFLVACLVELEPDFVLPGTDAPLRTFMRKEVELKADAEITNAIRAKVEKYR